MKPYNGPLAVVVPAAGVGKRMLTNIPKQYLTIDHQSVLEHTVERLLSHTAVTHIVVAISPEDEYINATWLPTHHQVNIVFGGQQRVDSVLAGLKSLTLDEFPWVLVHDAARPCLELEDLSALINTCLSKNEGGLLAYSVKDTMKRAQGGKVIATVERENLWHALTPQMYPTADLICAIEAAQAQSITITDESSAIEFAQLPSLLIAGSSNNIKITTPSDLSHAESILANPKFNRENI